MVVTKLSSSAAQDRAIPPEVVRAIRAVNATRPTDIYDRETVMMLAAAFGFEDEADWLVDHRHLYFIALEQSRAVEDEAPVRRVVRAS